nr:MAG TPA: hypothetical protein [Caudoviricetes sp.]
MHLLYLIQFQCHNNPTLLVCILTRNLCLLIFY